LLQLDGQTIPILTRGCKSEGVCQTELSILQARARYDAHTEETRIPKINRTPQIATIADSHMMAKKQKHTTIQIHEIHQQLSLIHIITIIRIVAF
jgi:hypothetical protein